uniref:Activin_recp domain-containing protein n=1 Tax=Haemonchus contortus TaxID=6289 RepID=A0A7I4YQB4_HAECO
TQQRNQFWQMAACKLLFVIFISLATSTAAIRCYTQALTNDSKPTRQLPCMASSHYCTKAISQSGQWLVRTYGCDTGLCLGSSCIIPTDGVTLCCCDTDLCNSSSSLFLSGIVIPIILVKLFML